MINRLYFSAEDVSQALIDAGFELRPEDCCTVKFWQLAEILGDQARRHMRRELDSFADTALAESAGIKRRTK